MGTRAVTVVKDSKGKKIIEMASQFDGYPEGLGKKLREFINEGKVVNGFTREDKNSLTFNGVECFAAQLICRFKQGVGGFYLFSPTRNFKDKSKYADLYGAEYYYEIDSDLNLKCWDTYENKEISLED